MMQLELSSRELVALYLALEKDGSAGEGELMFLQERISKRLCEALSIEQFETLESLYARGYDFPELPGH